MRDRVMICPRITVSSSMSISIAVPRATKSYFIDIFAENKQHYSELTQGLLQHQHQRQPQQQETRSPPAQSAESQDGLQIPKSTSPPSSAFFFHLCHFSKNPPLPTLTLSSQELKWEWGGSRAGTFILGSKTVDRGSTAAPKHRQTLRCSSVPATWWHLLLSSTAALGNLVEPQRKLQLDNY